MTAYENITAVLDRIEKVSRKGLNYVIELEDIEQLQEAQEQVKNNDLLHSVSQRYTIEDIERCVENWGLCKVEKEYIDRFLNGG